MGTNAKGSVLVVDDDRAVGLVLKGLLAQAGYEAAYVDSAQAALDRVAAEPVEVVLTDLRMPSMDGMGLLEALAERAPDVRVVMLTAHGTVENAVEAMKRGAADFLEKPFDREAVLFTVDKVMRTARHHAERAPDDVEVRVDGGDISLGISEAMQEVDALINRAAKSAATVLIRGESGSGKEIAARAIHERSPRAEGPFVPVHCAALPENLLESELFGYEKGAFTGATNKKPGRVELAQGGTLFLDEIGDVSASVQVKLLRLLQEKEYQRLGGTQSITADVRFLAATHRDLDEMVQEGEFREDLFYRLDVIPIFIPPLRERRADVPDLARRFVLELGETNGRPSARLSEDAVDRLAQLDWPGNVRELRNFIERMVVFADDEAIGLTDVERELARHARRTRSDPPSSGSGTLETQRLDAERAAIVQALEKAGGNRTKAARLLGVSRRTLYNKLSELDIT